MKTTILLRGLAGVALFVCASCATPARQTETLLAAERDFPDIAQVADVPYIRQTENYCGPATLAMVMQWAGRETTLEELGAEIYSAKEQGTVQTSLIKGARRRGFLAIPIQGLPNLLQEISAGHPVIVFENLAFRWYPRYHYAVATGYDLKEEEIVLHSGDERDKRWSLRKFERSWMLGDYWALVVLPPEKLSASASELAHADAGAALEEIGRLSEAKTVYEKILERWPTSLAALIGLGNIAYAENDFRASAKFLRRAVELHPTSSTAKNNLRVAEGRLPTMRKRGI
jgi:tetratricopeptide (TPR) repeat protein